MSTKLKDYQIMIKTMEKTRELANKIGQEAFAQGVKELFEKYKELETISFSAYTPYFADGSPCIYSANTDYPEINGISSEEIHKELDYGSTKYPAKNEHLVPILAEIVEFLGQFDNDFYREMYGDHITIIIKRDGIETEDCEHD